MIVLTRLNGCLRFALMLASAEKEKCAPIGGGDVLQFRATLAKKNACVCVRAASIACIYSVCKSKRDAKYSLHFHRIEFDGVSKISVLLWLYRTWLYRFFVTVFQYFVLTSINLNDKMHCCCYILVWRFFLFDHKRKHAQHSKQWQFDAFDSSLVFQPNLWQILSQLQISYKLKRFSFLLIRMQCVTKVTVFFLAMLLLRISSFLVRLDSTFPYYYRTFYL